MKGEIMATKNRKRSIKSSSAKSETTKKKSKGSTKADWGQGAKAASAGDFLPKLKEGYTYLKLAESAYYNSWVHWLVDPDGKKIGLGCQIDANKRGRKGDPERCKGCLAESEGVLAKEDTNLRYYFNVQSGKPKKVEKGGKTVKMMVFGSNVYKFECGPQIGGKICGYAEEIMDDIDGEWEEQGVSDITQVVLKIHREGTGKNSTNYDTRYVPNAKIKIVGDEVDFDSVRDWAPRPDSDEDYSKALGYDEDDEDEDEDFDEEERPRKKKKKKSKKKKSKKVDIEDDDEEDDEDFEEDDDSDEEDDEDFEEDFNFDEDEDEDDE